MGEPTPDVDLERVLRDLAPRIAYPPTPDLAGRVTEAVAHVSARQQRRMFGWRPFGRALPAALVGLVLVAGAAIAAGIGLRGLSIVFVDSSPHPIGQSLELGEPVSLAEAQRRVSYQIILPKGNLGEPDEVYLDVRAGIEQVSVVYRSADEAPMLITQFVATTDIGPTIKEVGPGTTVEPVAIVGEPGYWIEGSSHVLLYRDPSGALIEDRVRVVGSVLVWQRGDLTLRLEGATSKDAAVAIAESME